MRRNGARTPKPGGAGRSVRRNRLLALAILAILALAAVVPAGQASDGQPGKAERAQQRALRAAERAAERESLRLQRQTARAEHNKVVRQTEKHEGQKSVTVTTEKAIVTLTCDHITVEYHAFPEGPASNEIAERVVFKQSSVPLPSYAYPVTTFSFNGGSGTTTIPIVAPLGTSNVSLHTRYDTNGVKGRVNAHGHLYCNAIPQFTVVTEQSLSGGSPTTSTLGGKVGQGVVYETLAEDTGNTPLTMTNFSDPGCDDLPAGDPVKIMPHSTATYLCMHSLNNADLAAGLFANAASLTGTPEAGQGEPVTLPSSAVLISPIAAGEEAPKTPAATHEVSTSAAPAKSAVLGFSTSAVPALLGPSKCVHGPFTAGVKSSGVANVTFYLDGRKLSRRTAHSTRNGMISIRVGMTLKAGSKHRLKADITMLPPSPTVKAVTAWRGRIVRRCATQTAAAR
jgi:type II secretory pathway pseudopilin PulG